MIKIEPKSILEEFHDYITAKAYPCVAARAAMSREHIACMVADHMACPKDDRHILHFLYHFVDGFRRATTAFHSAAIIFKGPEMHSEEIFDTFLWQRLQSLAQLDAENFVHDKRVNDDPLSPDFSFSLAEEAFFIIGLHAASSRLSRQFKYPTLVFNPHAQFEQLRKTGRYENMKNIVRQRDIVYSGSINPMLADFGKSSEVYQYSGRQYDREWQCPLKVNHAELKHHSSQK
jgi:FPC/CPF motif-containing protein YcgG